jgi:pilus assembly protein Flp/PilA
MGAAVTGRLPSSSIIHRVLQHPGNQSALGFPCGIGAGRTRAASRQEFWMQRLFSKFLRDESGATAIEYCLIALGLSIVIIAVVNSIGGTLNTKITSVNSSLK